MWLLFFTL